MPLLYPFSVKIHTKKRSAKFALLSNICMWKWIVLVNCSPTWPLSTGLCDESRNLFYLYTLQSKTLTITNDVDVSITKYFLERRWQINVINKGWFFLVERKFVLFCFLIFAPNHPPLLKNVWTLWTLWTFGKKNPVFS